MSERPGLADSPMENDPLKRAEYNRQFLELQANRLEILAPRRRRNRASRWLMLSFQLMLATAFVVVILIMAHAAIVDPHEAPPPPEEYHE